MSGSETRKPGQVKCRGCRRYFDLRDVVRMGSVRPMPPWLQPGDKPRVLDGRYYACATCRPTLSDDSQR